MNVSDEPKAACADVYEVYDGLVSAAYDALDKDLANAEAAYAYARHVAYTDLDAALDAAYIACADVAHTDAADAKANADAG